MISNYKIDLPAFTGPLGLLLHLLDRQELDITTIALAQITGQYLAQIEKLKEGRVSHLIDFLVIGARLALIKSRALLPQTPTFPADEEEEDPAEALIRQLRHYKRFKQAAAWLHGREVAGLRTYLRVAPPPRLDDRLDLSGLTAETLRTAVLAALSRVERREDSISLAQPRRITLDGQMKRLRNRLHQKQSFQFGELLPRQVTRLEVAITLMAVLELIKRREAQARQPTLFGPIEITANGETNGDYYDVANNGAPPARPPLQENQ